MKTLAMLSAGMAVSAMVSSSLWADPEKFYAELDEWVFHPCMSARVALESSEIDEELIGYGANLHTFAVMLKAEKEDVMRDLANSIDVESTWQVRAEFYQQLFKICVQASLNE